MSLTQQVVKLIKAREGRCGTVDDIHPHLSGYTRQRVLNALQNARTCGLLSCDGHTPKRGPGGGRGSQGSVYRFVKDPEFKPRIPIPAYARHRPLRPIVSSVFHLATK